jgi:hypothetical protein
MFKLFTKYIEYLRLALPADTREDVNRAKVTKNNISFRILVKKNSANLGKKSFQQ